MSLENEGVDKLIGDSGGWNSTWAQGIVVMDEGLDLFIARENNEPLMTEPKEELSPGTASGEDFSQPLPPQMPSPNLNSSRLASSPFNITASSFTITLSSVLYEAIANRIRAIVDKYLWSEKEGIYYDWDCFKSEASVYESVTTFWPLWAGLASSEQAERVVKEGCRRFEVVGGLVSGTEDSRGKISLSRPNRQWDYPYGWAPHQILAWQGLRNYGYLDVAKRLSYRWLYTLTKSFVDFNGVVPEKFDVVSMTHRVNVEYGNVGTDFRYVTREGFGWMNASYVVSRFLFIFFILFFVVFLLFFCSSIIITYK